MGLHRRKVPFLPPLGIQDNTKLASHFFLNNHRLVLNQMLLPENWSNANINCHILAY